jgi:hypothetical protein
MKIFWNFRVLAATILLLVMLSSTAIAPQPAQIINIKTLTIGVNTNPCPIVAGAAFQVTVTLNQPVNGYVNVTLGSINTNWSGPINGTTVTTGSVFNSTNTATDYISVYISDVYGKELIRGVTPLNVPAGIQGNPIGIIHR